MLADLLLFMSQFGTSFDKHLANLLIHQSHRQCRLELMKLVTLDRELKIGRFRKSTGTKWYRTDIGFAHKMILVMMRWEGR